MNKNFINIENKFYFYEDFDSFVLSDSDLSYVWWVE